MMIVKKSKLLENIASILIDKIWGKFVGLLFIVIPSILFIVGLEINSLWQVILLVPLFYISLFIGGLTHELGHYLMLKNLRCPSKIKVFKNSHSKLIFFNMRTQVINDTPMLSSKYILIKRAIAGLLSNYVFSIILTVLGVILDLNILFFIAAIEGFSAHSATSLASLNSDTDVFNLKYALDIRDEIKINKIKIDKEFKINICVKLVNNNSNYWIIYKGPEILSITGDFLTFDLDDSVLFLCRNNTKKQEIKLHITLPCEIEEDQYIKFYTISGCKIQNESEDLVYDKYYAC